METHGATGLTENITRDAWTPFKLNLDMHEATWRALKYCLGMHGTAWSKRVTRKYYRRHIDSL